MEFSISKIVAEHIKNKLNLRDNNFWHGSDMGMCLRKRFYKRQGIETEGFDDRTLRVFECGHIFHEWLQKLLNKENVLLSCEELLKDTKLNYSGHYDALIKIDDYLILYDFKTVNSQAFSYYKKQGFPEYHKLQAVSYCYFLRKQFPKLEDIRILYISKDDLRIEECKFFYTKKLENKILEELNTLNEFWKLKKLPPRITKDYKDLTCKDNWQCAKKIGRPRKDGTYLYKPFCQYFEHCWKNK